MEDAHKTKENYRSTIRELREQNVRMSAGHQISSDQKTETPKVT